MFETKLLTPATWPDFEALFARHNGMHGGCWCVYHRMTMSEFIASTKTERMSRCRAIWSLPARRPASLLYDDRDSRSAGASSEAAAGFPAFDRMRDYVKLATPGIAPSVLADHLLRGRQGTTRRRSVEMAPARRRLRPSALRAAGSSKRSRSKCRASRKPSVYRLDQDVRAIAVSLTSRRSENTTV
ncbi:MAG: hypothetical protein MZW92_12605 [Comamonadaceae bacterium]|nr:hypothetical protein [Comamonadaceae bacterium]